MLFALCISLAATLPLCVTAAESSGFIPSVVAETVPEVKSVIGAGGEDLSEALNAMSLNDALKSKDNEDYKSLLDAYDEIKNVSSISELGIDLSEHYESLSADELVIRDLIDISLEGYDDYFETEGNALEVTFDLKIQKDDVIVILMRDYDGKWNIIDPKYIIINEDGSVTVTLHKAGVLAFGVNEQSKDKKSKELPIPKV